MKALRILGSTAVLLLLACAALWLRTPSSTAPLPADPAPDELPAALGIDYPTATAKLVGSAPRPRNDVAAAIVRVEAPVVRSLPQTPTWSMRIVDPSQKAIRGAQVQLVEIVPAREAGGRRARLRDHACKRTDADGIVRFPIPRNPERVGVVAFADGWLRTALAAPIALVDDAQFPLVVMLRPGSRLRGRVVDPQGQPVPNLELLAVTAGYNTDHVCLSSVAWRAQSRFADPRRASFQQSRTRSLTDGTVSFDGVPGGTELDIRSEDPGWRITASRIDPAQPGFVTWIATPVFGVLVHVLNATTRKPVAATATFRVDLDLADGSVREEGQWVGKGRGTLRFSLHEELLPGLAEMDVERATFRGTLTTLAGSRSWRAQPIFRPKRGGVAEVQVLVANADENDDAPRSSTPSIPLVLDVVGGDGQPYAAPLIVEWSSDTTVNKPQDEAPAAMLRPGSYRASVPVPGDVEEMEVRVRPENASGSVPPWSTTIQATLDGTRSLRVRLPSAGSVVLVRPAGWTSDWRVRTCYRQQPGDPWTESRTFRADTQRLRLNALLPAEWRFECAQGDEGEPMTYVVRVAAESRLLVGG